MRILQFHLSLKNLQPNLEERKIMETERNGDWRDQTLMKKKKGIFISQTLMRQWSSLLLAEKIATIFALTCALTAVAYILTTKIQVFSRNSEKLPQANDILHPLEGAKYRFLEEWKKPNQTFQGIQISFSDKIELESNDHTYRRRRWAVGEVTDSFDEDLLVTCAEIAENIKRFTKKCVGFELLPKKCASAKGLIVCDPRSRYRTINARCNNLYHPSWGMRGAALLRWVPADYADDVSASRRSVYGVPLPNARKLSNELFSRRFSKHSNITMFFVFFGLFLDHDIIFTKQSPDEFDACCTKEMKENPRKRFPDCYEIDIDASDPFFGPLNVTCMGILRDLPTLGDCPGRRENSNDMTSYIDGSDIYGTTDKEAASLREFKNGQLATIKGEALLPRNFTAGGFVSGDQRVNMVLQLMTFHTLWHREHNRLAQELHFLNPKWDDERLYQEARRILIAELQYVTYREFLPIIFGQERVKEYGLFPEADEDYKGYDENLDATIHNAFATAALRFGHTLIQDHAEFRDGNYKVVQKPLLREMYMNPKILYENRFDDIVRGMIAQKSRHVERATTVEVRDHLFHLSGMKYGMDLTAISIQRGWDHGIASYLKFRKFCELPVAKSWEDLYFYMKPEYVDSLRKMYLSVEDIDLLPGSLGEYHVQGAILGPTHLCLLKKQFLALRNGDRFWFQNANQPGSFTKEQLGEIYKSSMARIICDVSNGIKMVPIFPFIAVAKQNPVLPCEYIPKMNLSMWKEM